MKNLLELGIRLITLFYLYLSQLQLIGLIDDIISGIKGNYFPFSYYSAMQIILIIFGVLIFIKPNLITRFLEFSDDKIKSSLDINQLLRTGLILIGVYYLINSSSNLIYALMKLVNTKENTKDDVYFTIHYFNIIINGVLLFVSFILIKKSKYLSKYFLKENEQVNKS